MAVRNREMSELSCNKQHRTVYLTSYLIQPITETEHVIACVCLYKYEYIWILTHSSEKF